MKIDGADDTIDGDGGMDTLIGGTSAADHTDTHDLVRGGGGADIVLGDNALLDRNGVVMLLDVLVAPSVDADDDGVSGGDELLLAAFGAVLGFLSRSDFPASASVLGGALPFPLAAGDGSLDGPGCSFAAAASLALSGVLISPSSWISPSSSSSGRPSAAFFPAAAASAGGAGGLGFGFGLGVIFRISISRTPR